MKFVTAAAMIALAAAATPCLAANAHNPYGNINPTNDAGNDTGDLQVEALNQAQIDGGPLPAFRPAPSGRLTAPAGPYYQQPYTAPAGAYQPAPYQSAEGYPPPGYAPYPYPPAAAYWPPGYGQAPYQAQGYAPQGYAPSGYAPPGYYAPSPAYYPPAGYAPPPPGY